MILRGSKMYILEQLREIDHSYYPMVVKVPNPEDPSLTTRKGLFIKRSYSESSTHVWKADDKSKASTIRKVVQDTKRFYHHSSLRRIGVEPTFFGISYIPEMNEKGEIRTYFIGGELTYMISTRPVGEDLEMQQVFELTPLRLLS